MLFFLEVIVFVKYVFLVIMIWNINIKGWKIMINKFLFSVLKGVLWGDKFEYNSKIKYKNNFFFVIIIYMKFFVV